MTGQPVLRVLLVEDNDGDALLIREALEDADADGELRLERVAGLAEATTVLSDRRPDCILLDLGLPDASGGLDALRTVLSVAPSAAVVVLTGRDDDALAAEAVAFGAQDYLLKRADPSGGDLLRAVRFAAERAEATSRLRSTRDELAQFASLAAHDLRGPLSMIVGYADVLVNGGPMAADQQEALLQRISEVASRLAGGVASLLNYATDPGAARSRVRLADVIDWLLPLVRPQLERADGRLAVDDLEDVWSNEPAVRTVLLNLIANAIEHRSADRPPRVHVATRASGRDVVVEVTDNGSGIPPGERDRVFSPGWQLRGDQGPGGIGLGLSAVRRTVLQLDGRVWFEDTEDGIGIRACVALPRVPADAA